jgi:hypothetical protein
MSRKRIVLQHRNGLHQIIGWAETQPAPLLDGGDEGQFNLVALKRGTYYLYKPVMSPSETMQRFHEDQQ